MMPSKAGQPPPAKGSLHLLLCLSLFILPLPSFTDSTNAGNAEAGISSPAPSLLSSAKLQLFTPVASRDTTSGNGFILPGRNLVPSVFAFAALSQRPDPVSFDTLYQYGRLQLEGG